VAPRTSSSRLGRALSVSGFTLASRLLGLIREQLFAALLGASNFADAFVVAFRIPNLLRDLFAEGALSAAFVPTFAQVEAEEGRDRAYVLANRIVGGLLVVVGTLVALAMIFAPQLVWALAPGFDATKSAVTAQLACIMAPYLLFVSLSAVTMGMLNAQEHFSAPAMAPAFFNLAAIATGVLLYLLHFDPRLTVIGWSIGTVGGGVLQLLVQVPSTWRLNYRPRPRWSGNLKDAGVRRVMRLMAPATIGLAAVQLNIFVNTQFASYLPGANAWLNYAFRLMYLPIGIFGVAVATVSGAAMARRAAERDWAGLKEHLAQGIRQIAFLTLPSTVGLIVLAEPIIRLIYQRHRFSAVDTAATARALTGYAFGLFAYSSVKVAASAFYAMDRSRVPLVASACAVATNITFNALTYRSLQQFGLALGTSLGAVINITVLVVFFARSTRHLAPMKGVFLEVVKVSLASVAMGVTVFLLERWLAMAVGYRSLLRELFVVGVCLVAGVGSYSLMCRMLRVTEFGELVAGLKRRLLPSAS
jgi:putative peptidoglycan lipid II flippase